MINKLYQNEKYCIELDIGTKVSLLLGWAHYILSHFAKCHKN